MGYMNKNKIPNWAIKIGTEIEKNEKPLHINNIIKHNNTWRKKIYKNHHNSPGLAKWRTSKKWIPTQINRKNRFNYFNKGIGATESNNRYNSKVFNLVQVPKQFIPKTFSEMMNNRRK